MDRTRTQHVIDHRTMHGSRLGSFDVLLRAYAGKPRESGVDAVDRQAVPEASVLRSAAHNRLAPATGLCGQPQARTTTDVGDGLAGRRAGPAHQPPASGTSDLPVFIEGSRYCSAQSGVVYGHHVRADATRIAVSGGRHGLVQPVCAGVGTFQQPRRTLLRRGDGTSLETSSARYQQHRSGSAIHRPGICWLCGKRRSADQHGWTRPSDGQHHGGTVVAERQIRRNIFEGLCRRTRSLERIESVFSILQHGEKASGIESPNTCRGVFWMKREEEKRFVDSAAPKGNVDNGVAHISLGAWTTSEGCPHYPQTE